MDIVYDKGHEINERMIHVDVCEYCLKGVQWNLGREKHLRVWYEGILQSDFAIKERTTGKG